MKKENKILIILCHRSPEYYRNYVLSPALSAIKDNCYFLVHDRLLERDFPGISRERIFGYVYPPEKTSLHRHVFGINSWRARNKSSSFLFRFKNLKPRLQIIYRILAIPPLYQIAKNYFLFKARDEHFAEMIKKINPSVVLIPSGTNEGLTFEAIRICRTLNIPTLMLVDNWDNMSSKTIFTLAPDYLGAWGQQSLEQAIRIRDFPKEKIFILGAPRLIKYFQRDKSLPSPYPFKYILFAGCSFGFDEITCLKKLEEIIEKNRLALKVVYRPHPWQAPRKCADTFFGYDFRHVVIDEPARIYYKRYDLDDFSDIYMPDLNYYPRLLANMEFMICPLSTMLIEGLIFNKKVFVLAYDDGTHPNNPKAMYHSYEHLHGIERLKNIRMIFDFNDLEKIFSAREALKGPENPIELDYFISDRTGDYPALLKEAIEKILIEWPHYINGKSI